MNQNSIEIRREARVLFVDMNSFFARCEQQTNFWLRGRPVAVCVYTGQYGCAIALSVEAKKAGVKTGMRLNEAMRICPNLVPVESHPQRYRDFHKKIIGILKRYCDDVVPKSIDEAIVNLTNYRHLHPDPVKVAKKIQQDIRREVGDWLTCSIGIAPNTWLGKLGSSIGGVGQIVEINPENIDQHLKKLRLRDLPGIGGQMEKRLLAAGIMDPLQMRNTEAHVLKRIFKSVEGTYWHYRLNFGEVGMFGENYKHMQAMRQLSAANRSSPAFVESLFRTLCLTLERRMVGHNFYCHSAGFAVTYTDGTRWEDGFRLSIPVQDGISLMRMFEKRIRDFETQCPGRQILNGEISSMRAAVGDFMNTGEMNYSLFEDIDQQEKARKTLYDLKKRFGSEKLMRASEVYDGFVVKDVIGFGSVKDLTEQDYLDAVGGDAGAHRR
ncbi:MAG: DNA polymerase IV [Mucilaginibacter polytrichastri]|nr:DNA polymerase IV [Mucilaginibacter polytrichastri]